MSSRLSAQSPPNHTADMGAVRSCFRGVDEPEWTTWPDDKLLQKKISELHVRIKGSGIEQLIHQLYRELEAKELKFRPHFWLSDDWYTPDGVPGCAIPFYMVHERLAGLELSQMLEIEGGAPGWCMRILRHECGHAIDNAFRLRRKRARQRMFGLSSRRYPDSYTPRPYSKSFVQHLDFWYAQSHPDEDFAETFAVWLTPGSQWQERYAGWRALKKLQCIDAIMSDLKTRAPSVTQRKRTDALPQLKRTLASHYATKRERYGLEYPDVYDRDLRRLFPTQDDAHANGSAARFLRRVRKEVRRKVATWTGLYQYTIDQVFDDIIDRCRELDLKLSVPEDQAKMDFTVLLTVQTINYLHSGRHQVAL